MAETIRILIADDHAIVREGLRALISSEPGMMLVGEATNGLEAIRQAQLLNPDVVLLDLVMPCKDGIQAIEEIKQRNPAICILVLTSFSGDDKIFPAIKAGALGYILKDSTPQELLQAIRAVYRGEPALHPTIARRLIHELNRPSEQPFTETPFTQQETRVLVLIAHGLSNQEIADRLIISERTVRVHVSNILSKVHLANRTQAALYALREGLTTLD
jgi:NarL family two-component system response regulator LiaR